MTKAERLELLKRRVAHTRDPLHEVPLPEAEKKRKLRAWRRQRVINRVEKGIPRHPWRD